MRSCKKTHRPKKRTAVARLKYSPKNDGGMTCFGKDLPQVIPQVIS
jgi:hypothetical protein